MAQSLGHAHGVVDQKKMMRTRRITGGEMMPRLERDLETNARGLAHGQGEGKRLACRIVFQGDALTVLVLGPVIAEQDLDGGIPFHVAQITP